MYAIALSLVAVVVVPASAVAPAAALSELVSAAGEAPAPVAAVAGRAVRREFPPIRRGPSAAVRAFLSQPGDEGSMRVRVSVVVPPQEIADRMGEETEVLQERVRLYHVVYAEVARERRAPLESFLEGIGVAFEGQPGESTLVAALSRRQLRFLAEHPSVSEIEAEFARDDMKALESEIRALRSKLAPAL